MSFFDAIYSLLLLLLFVIPDSLLLFDLLLLLGNMFPVFDHIYTIFPFKGMEGGHPLLVLGLFEELVYLFHS